MGGLPVLCPTIVFLFAHGALLILPNAMGMNRWMILMGMAGLWRLVAAEVEGTRYEKSTIEGLDGAAVGFTLMEPELIGITFTNQLSLRRGLANQNLMNGSGVAAGDFDGDGLCDLYFCGRETSNRLYRNLGGWRFEDVTESAGVACAGQDSSGAVFVDVDGDGALDLLVAGIGPGIRLFINDGAGGFVERTDAAGVRQPAGSTSMALSDFDRDGDLDLYVANIPRFPVRNQISVEFKVERVDGEFRVTSINGQPATAPEFAGRFEFSPSGEVIEYGEVDFLFRNKGDGTFSRESFVEGLFMEEGGTPLEKPPMDWGLAARFHDWNGDGWPDLYVCNDLWTPDRFWINTGSGTFKAAPAMAIRRSSLSSMNVDVADIDRDGDYDFFVTDMLSRDRIFKHTQFAHVPPPFWDDSGIGERLQFSQNTLLINRGDMTFAETAYYSGVAATEWTWGCAFLDVDLDGYEDLLAATGQQRNLGHGDFADGLAALQRAKRKVTLDEVLAIGEDFPVLDTPNMAFRNRGDLIFEEMSQEWGFDAPMASQGMALADLDNDGDLDVVLNNALGPAAVFRNDSTASRIAVSLRGAGPNTHGIGAEVIVTGGPVVQRQEIISGGRYLSSDEQVRVFACGADSGPMTIEVRWPSGVTSWVRNARANHRYKIFEPGEKAPRPSPSPGAQPVPTLFVDRSDALGHSHVDRSFNDFQWQPLLPFKLSRNGPGISWFDLNGDGRDELIVPAEQGGRMGIFVNEGEGAFRRIASKPATDPVMGDQPTVLGWVPGMGVARLLAAMSNYEPAPAGIPAVEIYDLTAGELWRSLSDLGASPGPMAMADVDGDGGLELFVGTMAKRMSYPEALSGYLYKATDDGFELVQTLEDVGIINSAVFTDLDEDGFSELVLACEWGPVRLFSNVEGRFTEVTEEWGMVSHTGLWRGLAVADFDNDGRQDLVAANWGLNSPLQMSDGEKLIAYYGDADESGSVELIVVDVDPDTGIEYPRANMNMLAAALPWIRLKAPDYDTYSTTPIQELLGDSMTRLKRLEIRRLQSTLFLNRGGTFEAVSLPAEAQWTPASGVCAGDFNGDGAEDLFLSQNEFGTSPMIPRQDAGRGLLLLGDGAGAFTAVPGQESGIQIYGEQRGSGVSDFNNDGRLDLAVVQNGGQTKLYENQGATAGIRVQLRGPARNGMGIGAVVRLEGVGPQPAKELSAGSGYWSQNTATVLIPKVDKEARVNVRWPGGEMTTVEVGPDTREIEVRYGE